MQHILYRASLVACQEKNACHLCKWLPIQWLAIYLLSKVCAENANSCRHVTPEFFLTKLCRSQSLAEDLHWLAQNLDTIGNPKETKQKKTRHIWVIVVYKTAWRLIFWRLDGHNFSCLRKVLVFDLQKTWVLLTLGTIDNKTTGKQENQKPQKHPKQIKNTQK